jgi:hypothetical protein
MDVTRTVWFEGSVDEFKTLQRMLEAEGVRVEVPLWVDDRQQRQDVLDRVKDQLRGSSDEMGSWWSHVVESQAREDQRQLQQRQGREGQELQQRQERERQELQQRHEHEQQELEESHQLRRERLEAPADPFRRQGELQAQLAWILADVNQVVVSLMSTGATLAIAEAVKKFRERHPRSKVEVLGEKVDVEEEKAARLKWWGRKLRWKGRKKTLTPTP